MAHATTTIGATLAGALMRHHDALARRLPATHEASVNAVHRARVSSRRLREVLAVAAVVRRGGDGPRLRRAVRRLTRALGPVRELDVAMDELAAAVGRHDWSADCVAAVRRRLERERERRGARLAAKTGKYDRAELRRRCRDVVQQISVATTDAVWWNALTARAARRADGVRIAAAACGTLYAPEPLHALRIAVKKFRYALELIDGVPGLDVRRAIRALKRAQDRFGHLHDVQVLLAEVRTAEAAARRAADRAGMAQIVETLERECREIHARLLPQVAVMEAQARSVKQELAARRRGRRLTMAKAQVQGSRVRAVEGSKVRAFGHSNVRAR